jgi:hypothetical protein
MMKNAFPLSDNEILCAKSPWVVWLSDGPGEKHIAVGKNGEVIAYLPHRPEGWLNAQFIRQACNAHGALVSALADIAVNLGYGSFDKFQPAGTDLHVDMKIIRRIHAALDLASGRADGDRERPPECPRDR